MTHSCDNPLCIFCVPSDPPQNQITHEQRLQDFKRDLLGTWINDH